MSAEAVAAVATPELDKRSRVALTADRKAAEVLTEFCDWLAEQGVVLAKWGEPYETSARCPDCPTIKGVREAKLGLRERQLITSGHLTRYEREQLEQRVRRRTRSTCPGCGGSGTVYTQKRNPDRLYEVHEQPERLFARFFDLNLDAIEDERRAMLKALRE